MAPEYSFDGALVENKVSFQLSMDELLDFIASNWMRVPADKRVAFKTRLISIELGLEKMPEPDDMPDDPPIYW